MQMSEVTEVVQVVVAENANKRLADGWKLLAVTSADNGDDSGRTFVWYVLGKPAVKAKGEFRADWLAALRIIPFYVQLTPAPPLGLMAFFLVPWKPLA